MQVLIPNIILESPTLKTLMSDFRASLAELQNSTRAMSIVLEETQIDIDEQFDEKQGEWKQNAPFTIRKKERNNQDLRVMHESTQKGLRLRDAYKTAGVVVGAELTYFYPLNKPYAKLLQKGGTIDSLDSADDKRLDEELGSIFGFNVGSITDLFKKARKPRRTLTNAERQAKAKKKKKKKLF